MCFFFVLTSLTRRLRVCLVPSHTPAVVHAAQPRFEPQGCQLGAISCCAP